MAQNKRKCKPVSSIELTMVSYISSQIATVTGSFCVWYKFVLDFNYLDTVLVTIHHVNEAISNRHDAIR